jgi:hypothetical protein
VPGSPVDLSTRQASIPLTDSAKQLLPAEVPAKPVRWTLGKRQVQVGRAGRCSAFREGSVKGVCFSKSLKGGARGAERSCLEYAPLTELPGRQPTTAQANRQIDYELRKTYPGTDDVPDKLRPCGANCQSGENSAIA